MIHLLHYQYKNDTYYFLSRNYEVQIIAARKRSLGQGNIFTPVCHSVHKGGSTGQVPPRDQVHPRAVHAGRYGQQAGGTHPTGMHSCLIIIVDALQNLPSQE